MSITVLLIFFKQNMPPYRLLKLSVPASSDVKNKYSMRARDDASPHTRNCPTCIRKTEYKKLKTMMSGRYARNHPRYMYQAKKAYHSNRDKKKNTISFTVPNAQSDNFPHLGCMHIIPMLQGLSKV